MKQTLGRFRLREKLGGGGMGDVYLAEDQKLGRSVAIKILPEVVSQDKERVARFEREARLLAGLNHPNIATLYDLEQDDGVFFLSMELVPGETLQDRIVRGPISADEALPILLQIAEALEAAHTNGVVHRDLKPANIKVTPEGKVKVLDFGLAKAIDSNVGDSDSSQSPTLDKDVTAAGIVMGTASYMSPEQARGKAVDKRTDIWAFGAVLYEALTGRKAFAGETLTDTVASVIHTEPDFGALPETTPRDVGKLVRRCLRKDPRQRLHDIADARTELEEVSTTPPLELSATEPVPTKKTFSRLALAATGLLVSFIGAFVAWNLKPAETPRPIRFGIPIDAEHRLGGLTNSVYQFPLALSPDGTKLAYVAQGDIQQLFLRRIDDLEAQPLDGTAGATNPFFSPDGEWVGFFAHGELRKVSLSGGAPQTLCEATREIFQGASWGSRGSIVFYAGGSGLKQVSANGGEPETLTTPTNEEDPTHYVLQFLPTDQELLFLAGSRPAVLDLDTGTWDLIDGMAGFGLRGAVMETTTRYLPTGHLAYVQATGEMQGQLMAVPFDLDRREARGTAVLMIEGIHTPQRFPFFAISANGTLAYVPSPQKSAELMRVNRSGEATRMAVEQGFSDTHPRFSPDGQSIAIDLVTGDDKDIWVLDSVRGTRTRLTFGGDQTIATWNPDGSQVAVSLNHDLYLLSVDGSGKPEPLFIDRAWQWPTSWSPDGDAIAYTELNTATGFDVGVLSLASGSPSALLATPFKETGAKFSPNGRWIAYTSDESGRDEVYVRPYPGPGKKTLVLTNGGSEPTWSGDEREIFYRLGRQVLAAEVQTEPEFRAGQLEVLFEGPYDLAPFGEQHYDVSPDGQQFAMIRLQALPQVNITLHWLEELKTLVPD